MIGPNLQLSGARQRQERTLKRKSCLYLNSVVWSEREAVCSIPRFWKTVEHRRRHEWVGVFSACEPIRDCSSLVARVFVCHPQGAAEKGTLPRFPEGSSRQVTTKWHAVGYCFFGRGRTILPYRLTKIRPPSRKPIQCAFAQPGLFVSGDWIIRLS